MNLSKDDHRYLKTCQNGPGTMYEICEVCYSIDINNDVLAFWSISSAIGTCKYNLAFFFISFLINSQLLFFIV